MIRTSANKKQVGQGLVEYSMILVLVALATVIGMMVLGPTIGNAFSRISENLGVMGPGIAPGGGGGGAGYSGDETPTPAPDCSVQEASLADAQQQQMVAQQDYDDAVAAHAKNKVLRPLKNALDNANITLVNALSAYNSCMNP
jgi:Flp pilus assembly pilin Flp